MCLAECEQTFLAYIRTFIARRVEEVKHRVQPPQREGLFERDDKSL